ncbi:MAG: hypothetical protein K8S23_06580 [Candidatus Cloacimonetes bacterium]|nr:hypothetical protein [Candidatus Cloacimonadota bacterium]
MEADSSLSLIYHPIIINSETVISDSILLNKHIDYKIDYQKFELIPFKPYKNLGIEYMIYPPDILREFSLYEYIDIKDTLNFTRKTKRKQLFSSTTKLNITGSKTISVSVANDADFSLDQSLFLKMSGELSNNMMIEAQLSDSQSPITPEGDTRELSSLDKIFLRLYGKQYELSFGDLEMEFTDTYFLNYTPKFEGLKAGWFKQNKFYGALAISKGKKTSVTFNGIDANQGPYYLQVENNTGVRVIPGSESVFLDGISLGRGSDYVIDYADGSIIFANKHFISDKSFIQVTFQYSDDNYKQNMYLTSYEIKLTDKVKLNFSLINEQDDKNNPLEYVFTDADLDSLKNAGDTATIGQGIFEVEEGIGAYELSETGDYYVYTGSDSTGSYNIFFVYQGYQQADYEISDFGDYYIYVGDNEGSYIIGKSLKAPQNKTNLDLKFSFENDLLKIYSEGFYSNLDKNTFSSIDDKDNNSFATFSEIQISPDLDKIKPVLTLNYRKITDNIATFSEFVDPLDNFEMIQIADSLASDEVGAKLSLNFSEIYIPSWKVKHKLVKNYAKQNFFEWKNKINQTHIIPDLNYRLLNINQSFSDKNDSFIVKESNLSLHDLKTSYLIKKIRIGTNYNYSKNNTSYIYPPDFEFTKVQHKYFFKTENISKFSGELFYLEAKEDSLYSHEENKHTEKTNTIGIKSLLNTKSHSFQIALSHIVINDTLSKSYDLIDFSTRNYFLKEAITIRTSYGIKNLQFYPKIKEFIYVGTDNGSYYADTTYVGLGEGNYDWEITGTNYKDPELSVEVNANIRTFITPKMIMDNYLKRFQWETHLQIIENSKATDRRKVYYFHPDFIMNDEETLHGQHIFRNIFWYELIPHKLTHRTTFERKKTLDNRYQDIDKTLSDDWEFSLTLSKFYKTNLELIYENKKQEESHYNSKTKTDMINLDIRNRLFSETSLTSSIRYISETGSSLSSYGSYDLKSIEISEKTNFYFFKKYRLFGKFTYKKNMRSGDFLSSINEKKNGNIFKWFFTIDYRFNNYTTVNLEYSGKKYPDDKSQHKMELEVKAEF